MKKVLRSFLPLLLLMVVACSKKEDATPTPAPLAVASFTMARAVAEVGESVQLTNTSQNASRYEWTSSDSPGTINTLTNVAFSNAQPGTYSITLTAYNSENKPSSTTQVIRIGRRYVTEVRVTQLNFFNSSGQPWDSGSGPDVKFTLSRNGTGVANGNIINNVTSALLPLSWNLAPLNLESTSGPWSLTFIEGGNLFGDTTMQTFSIDESIPPTNRDAAGAGSKTGTANGWQIQTVYQTR